MKTVPFVKLVLLVCTLALQLPADAQTPPAPTRVLGHRFLTFNAEICVNQIETTRTSNAGVSVRKEDLKDEKHYRAITPERVKAFREAIEKGFSGARITWGISWKALHDTTPDFIKIREMLVAYHYQYGDDITLMPHSWFPNVYNSVEQLNRDFHEGLAEIGRMVGKGFRPKSVIAGFLAAPNLEYLAEKENIHVCQGNTWSQYSIDNQDGDGSISYPYYPSKEHFCKPAQGKADFIDCVNLDAITMDFLSARREGFKDGNSRLGVGPIETLLFQGKEKGLKQMLHTTALHFDKPNFEANGFAWVTNMWELFLPIEYDGLTEWLAEVKRRWPDTQFITQGEFGLLWREQFKENTFNYRFVEKGGTGIAGSDSAKQIRWFMNKRFRLALLSDAGENMPEEVIDFTRYDVKATEPKEFTRKWSLLGAINQKQTRPQDAPRPMSALSPEQRKLIEKLYPDLTAQTANLPEREQWFMDLGFGMFIHWSFDSQLGAVISHSMAGASKDYLQRFVNDLPKTFNPRKFNPEDWAVLAKLAGMKYVVFTAKHHSGFCMWSTKTTEFGIANTPFKRDIMREVIEAFRKQGIAIGIYFSPEDFHYFYKNNIPIGRLQHDLHYPVNNKGLMDYDKAQIKELLTQYGKIDIFFFDGPAEGLKEYAWQLQPSIVVTRGHMQTPEQYLPDKPLPGPWEANFTMGTDWQYKPTNDPHKTGTQIINMLIETRAKGGNLLMNIGPKPDGEIQIEQEALLREIALWNWVNTEGIHNIRPWEIIREGDVWFTRSKTEPNTVYAFVQGGDSWRYGSRKEILLKTLTGNAQTKVSVLGFSGELIEYRKGADAKAYVFPTPLGLLISTVRGPRLYTNGQWPNPVVLKLENVTHKPEDKILEEKSTIDGAI